MSNSQRLMPEAQLLAESTVFAERLLHKVIESSRDVPAPVLQMGLTLAMMAHGSAMRTVGGCPMPAVDSALLPAGVKRAGELGEWFIEQLTEAIADEDAEARAALPRPCEHCQGSGFIPKESR